MKQNHTHWVSVRLLVVGWLLRAEWYGVVTRFTVWVGGGKERRGEERRGEERRGEERRGEERKAVRDKGVDSSHSWNISRLSTLKWDMTYCMSGRWVPTWSVSSSLQPLARLSQWWGIPLPTRITSWYQAFKVNRVIQPHARPSQKLTKGLFLVTWTMSECYPDPSLVSRVQD